MQIPSLGLLEPQCLGIVGKLPLWTALLVVLLRYGSSPVWSRRPIWLRRFAAEKDELPSLDDEEAGGDDGPRRASKAWTGWTLTLLLLNVAAVLLGGFSIVLWPEYAQASLTHAIPSFVSVTMLLAERPRTLPGAVFIVNSTSFLAQLVLLAHDWEHAVYSVGGTMPLMLALLVTMLNMPMRDPLLGSAGIGKPFDVPNSSVRSPEDIITLWQWMSVSWLAPLIKMGSAGPLNEKDVWFLPYEFHHNRTYRLFRELKGSSLFIRVLKANGLDLIITTALGVLETCAQLIEPVFLKHLLTAMTSEPRDNKTALIYSSIILLLRLIKAQSGVFSTWYQRRNYERSRGEMITTIYEKTLRRKAFTFGSGKTEPAKVQGDETPLSTLDGTMSSTTLTDSESDTTDTLKTERRGFSWAASRLCRGYQNIKPFFTLQKAPEPEKEDFDDPASTGKILNLMRADVYEVAQRLWEFPWVTTKPLSLVVSIMLIWHVLGPAALSGVAVILVGIAIHSGLVEWNRRVEEKRRKITDDKTQQTTQFVEAIRHLRWYDWQGAWLERIMKKRQEELSKRVLIAAITQTMNVVNSLTGLLFPVAGFLAYTMYSGRPLTVDVAFPALELFKALQNNLRELPGLFTNWMNASVSMKRLERFMQEPEKEDLDQDDVAGTVPLGKLEITLRNASFAWPRASRKILRDISAVFQPGLSVVCGRVGVGKTALLQALLGELDQEGGERVMPREMVGYCAQTPWLESMSIRDNILFCQEYEKDRLDAVLEAVCLKEDLDKFKARDLTKIGENGVGLSGGQKARVALARAIYSRARILLLDDPIAALDHQTATSILRNLFSSYSSLTAGRIVVLVTHRTDIAARYADQILEIFPGGRVEILNKSKLDNMDDEELEHVLAEASGTKRPGSASSSGTGSPRSGEAEADDFIEEERRPHGGVLAAVYWKYMKSGGLWWWAAMVFFYALYRTVSIAYIWFIKEWGEAYIDSASIRGRVQHQTVLMSNAHMHATGTGNWIEWGQYLPSPNVDVRPWLWWFLVISMAQVVTLTLGDGTLVIIVYQAGKNLFKETMSRVTFATFRFYDVTPVGRLMNRLTSDMGTVDGQIANQIMWVGWHALGWVSSVVAIASATPVFLMLSVVMSLGFALIFKTFLPTSQSLRRLETTSLSPLLSNFGTLVEGLTTVRAFRASAHFQRRIISTTDAFQKMDHIYWSLQAWLQIRFDTLSSVTTFVLTVTAMFSGVSGGVVGFVLAAASNFVSSTHDLCRKYGEMQMQFVSVERVVEMLTLDQESPGTYDPPAAWPSYNDDIVFDGVTIRYAPNLDPVLVDVDLRIPAGSSVAVTGRTGSGKSTLALSLLGTLHPDPDTGGTVRIGDVDLATVNKHALRRNITFVAQDPVLFPGTLRDNLDPLNEHDDTDCASVLDKVLGHPEGSLEPAFTLKSPVDAGGKNLSQGQRQLVGLGRAMLRRSPVVVMDEATASIDAKTAAYIQHLLREELKQSTVITIAHKREAVKDADFEVVLDHGRVIRAGPISTRSTANRPPVTGMTIRSIFTPWMSHIIPGSLEHHLGLRQSRRWVYGDEAVWEPFPGETMWETWNRPDHWRDWWRSISRIMNWALVADVVTLVGFILVMMGGMERRQKRWKVLCGLLGVVTVLHFWAVTAMRIIYDEDHLFLVPGFWYDSGFWWCYRAGFLALVVAATVIWFYEFSKIEVPEVVEVVEVAEQGKQE
ncbi:hypothetical protein OQA88_11162 [Cercophora sp. LCS_1]